VWLFNYDNPQVGKCRGTFKREFNLVIRRTKKEMDPSNGSLNRRPVASVLFSLLDFVFLSLLYSLSFINNKIKSH
jgi:hypothetical protein